MYNGFFFYFRSEIVSKILFLFWAIWGHQKDISKSTDFRKDIMAQYGSMGDRDQSNLDATRAQVNEVQNIMKINVDKIMESEAKLGDLEGRADQLKVSQI